MTSDCNLFSRQYLGCQPIYGDLNKFVCHANHPCPLSLSLGDKLRLGPNADTLPYVEVEAASSEESPPVDAQFLDGAAVVQMLNPGTVKTLLDYAVHGFCPICTWKALLVLTLFGMYFKQIGKDWQMCAETSCSLCIDSKTLEAFPKHVDENKTELLSFL